MYQGHHPDERLWREQSTFKIRRALDFFMAVHDHLHTTVPEVEARIELLKYLLFDRVSMKETIH